MRTPVIFLVFNRPDLTVEVFERIREARPPQLFVVCDGPREGVPGECEKVAAVRALIERGVDWPCEVHREYAAENMGCRNRVSSGLTWAFSKVEEAIVLEDDCLPEPTFFGFCEELLARYRDDPRVMHIGGNNLAAPYLRRRESYWFGHHPAIWGWASWRRAWEHYDVEMREWDARLATMRASFASRWEAQFWLPTFDRARLQGVNASTWDTAWAFACRSVNGICILPTTNLVRNIGFGEAATHTTEADQRLQIGSKPMPVIHHPKSVTWDRFADELFTRAYANEPIDFKTNLLSRLRIWRDRLSGASSAG